MLVEEQEWGAYLAVHFEPNITLGFPFDHWADGHQTDDEGLPFLDGYMHLFSDFRTPQEVPGWNHTKNTL
jgi:hypothetical protein